MTNDNTTKTLDLFSKEFIDNFNTLNLLTGDSDIVSAEGTSYTPITEDSAKVDEFFTTPGEEKIMSKVQDPSDIAGAKAKVKAKEDELSLEAMKYNLQDSQDDLFSSVVNNFGTSNNFMDDFFQNPPIAINVGNAYDANLLNGAKKVYDAEYDRIEKLLFETVPNYRGGKEVSGFLNSTDRDRLTRKMSFIERRAYWKRVKGDDAQYFRMPIAKLKNGKTIYEELVSLTPNGEVYRVDPSGALTAQEIFNDIGDISGTLLTARTGLTIGGALFGAGLGPGILPLVYGGSYLGQIIDKALVSEGVDPSDRKGWQRLLDGDAAMLAAFDTALTFVPPYVGRALKDLITGAPMRLMPIQNVPKSAVLAQQTAETFKLPKLTITQVADDPMWNGIFSQVGAISGRIGNILKGQRQGIYNYLQSAVDKSGLNSLSPNALRYYVNGKTTESINTLKSLIEKNMSGLRYATFGKNTQPLGKTDYKVTDPSINAQKFINELSEIKKANFKINDDIWQKALSSENSKGVYFDTTSLKQLANDIKTGVYTQIDETIPGSTVTSSILNKQGQQITTPIPESTVSVPKQLVNFKSQLGDILETLTKLTNDTVTNFTVPKSGGGSATFSGVKQLQTIRQQLSGLLGREGQVPPEVIPTVSGLIKEIDNVILNPKGGNSSFLNSWKEGQLFYTMNKDIDSFSKISTLFSREASVNPHEYVSKFWTGEWGKQELNLLNKYLETASRTGSQEMKRHATNLKSAMENGFADFILYEPVKGVQRLQTIIDDPALFKALVPDARNRKAFTNFLDEQTWIKNGSANKILQYNGQRTEQAREFIKNSTSTDIWQFINSPQQKTLRGFDKTGINSEMASDLRASIIEDILGKAQSISKGAKETNVNFLSKELFDLSNFRGEYAKFKPLFVPSKGTLNNGEIVYTKPSKLQTDYAKNLSDLGTYVSYVKDTPDVGGAFSAGSVRSNLTSINPFKVFEAAKVIMANSIWARMLSRPVTVTQLQRMTNQGDKLTRPNVINALSGALATTYEPFQFLGAPNVGTMKETIEQEMEATGKNVPEGVGPVSSANITPNTLPLQNLSPAPTLASLQVPKGNVKSNVDYGLLFPNDPIGQAINQRKQGIMGLT